MREIKFEDLDKETPVFGYKRAANYYETDQMGIVHHSNYIRWFEEARLAQMEAVGIPYQDLEANGILIPVLGVDVTYKKAVRFGETVIIEPKVIRYTGIKMKITYVVKDSETDEVCCVGSSSHGFVDKELKPLYLKKIFPDIHEKFAAIVEED